MLAVGLGQLLPRLATLLKFVYSENCEVQRVVFGGLFTVVNALGNQSERTGRYLCLEHVDFLGSA